VIVFGIITPKSRYDAPALADEIEKHGDDDWDWVLFELNKSYHAVISGSLTMRGKVSRIKGIETTTVGEVIEGSEDNRSEWIVPRSRSGASSHQVAARKIANFIDIAYSASQPKGLIQDEHRGLTHPAERKVVTPRRRAYTGSIVAYDDKEKPAQAAPASKPAVGNGKQPEMARKSRRQKS